LAAGTLVLPTLSTFLTFGASGLDLTCGAGFSCLTDAFATVDFETSAFLIASFTTGLIGEASILAGTTFCGEEDFLALAVLFG
jgi:hypothetical protein